MDSQSGSISSSISAFFGEQPQLQEILLSSSGGTSVTYRILKENKYYFIKQLKQEYVGKSSYENMFRKEYEVGKSLDCEYFPRYIDFTETEGVSAILMEYVEGLTLNRFIDEHPRYFCSNRNLKRFLSQLLRALQKLHSYQIVHLDIKPENILLTTVNNDVRIIDLGFCYTDSMPFTQGRTDSFAAPEQFQLGNKVDTRTDIFAVGKVLEYILDRISSKNKVYRKISRRCCCENPDKRYQKEEEILTEMNSFVLRNRVSILLFFLAVISASVGLFFFTHLNNYDFVWTGYHTTEPLYVKIIDNGRNAEVTYQYDWGRSYLSDLQIVPVVDYEGKSYTVTAIGDSAFLKSPLRAFTLPQTIKTVGSWAFDLCTELSVINLPDGVTELGEGCFAGCTRLSSVRLSSSLTNLPRMCFFKSGIEEIFVPEGVEEIGQDAFVDCDALTKVHLPSTLKALDRGVFYHCDNLQRVDIPAGVTSLGDFLFMKCPNLKEVYDYAKVPQRCTELFSDDQKKRVVIYVPKESLQQYLNTQGWQDLNIKSIPFCSYAE